MVGQLAPGSPRPQPPRSPSAQPPQGPVEEAAAPLPPGSGKSLLSDGLLEEEPPFG